MRVLFVGDIYGRPGRRIASAVIPKLKQDYSIDFVIANAENAAGGFGLTINILHKLERYGIDCITSGNHLWDKKEIIKGLDSIHNLLRPANYPESVKGRGAQIFHNKIGVINLVGRTFMPNVDCPFRTAVREIASLNTKIIIIDFHAESSVEKKALAVWLDGKVSAVIGSHTHVQTADAQILPNGTAYITDVGMTGPFDSVIGVVTDKSIKHFIQCIPQRFDTAAKNEWLNGVVLDIDEQSGKTVSIKSLKI